MPRKSDKKEKPVINLTEKEAEVSKIEELNRRERKALDDRAEILRTKRDIVDMEETDDGDDLFENAAIQLDPDFSSVLQSLASQGSVHIFKETDQGHLKVGSFPIIDAESLNIQMDKIARRHKGGDFLVRLLNSKGQYAKNHRFSFDPAAYGAQDENAKPQNNGGETDRIIALINESRRETMDLFKTLIPALVQKEKSPFSSLQDIMALVQTLGKNSGPIDLKNTADFFLQAMSMGREIAEGKTPGEPQGDGGGILKDLVAPFLSIMSNMSQKPAAQLPANLKKQPVAAATPKPIQELKEDAMTDPAVLSAKNSISYKFYVPQLLKMAREKANPEDVAADVLNTIPEQYHGMLLKLAASEDVINYLAAFEPAVLDNVEWVKAVVAEILNSFQDGEEGEEADITDDAVIEPSINGHQDAVGV
jgi:hypothetical protein